MPSGDPPPHSTGPSTGQVARWAFIVTVVAGSVVVLALALWKLRLVVGLLFLAFTVAAAMRPGIDALARRRVPRSVAILLHYAVLIGLIALFLSFVIPQLTDQVEAALASARHTGTAGATGIKHDLLNAINKRLRELPSAGKLIHPALSVGKQAAEIVIGIFFAFAAAAYWIFERDSAIDLVTRLIARPKRKKVRDTWDLIDARLGAFVRGQVLLVALVAAVVSAGFWLIGEPYWLLLGIATGLLEVVPVIGPMAALALAVGAGLTHSWHLAAFAAAIVLGVRFLQDYFVTPRVLGGAVGVSPLLILISVFATGILLGGFYVLLAIPISAALVTIVDVVAFGTDPAEIETPSVLFTRDAEG